MRDREHVADLLCTHAAQGRLTVAEYSERLDRAYAATTQAGLDLLLEDLPADDAAQAAHQSKPGTPLARGPIRYALLLGLTVALCIVGLTMYPVVLLALLTLLSPAWQVVLRHRHNRP